MANELRPRPFGGPANQPWFDRYTSAHAGVGLTFAYYGMPTLALLVAVVGWELVENVLKDRFPSLFPYSSHDSLGNSITDGGSAIVAYLWARAALADPNITPRTRAAIASGAAATIGGIVGAAGFGLVGKIAADPEGANANRFGSIGYVSGAAAGAGLGLMAAETDTPETATAIAAAGGAAGGPLGAVMAAYFGQAVTEEG